MWQHGPELLWSDRLIIPNQQIMKIERSDPEVSLKACTTKLITKPIIDHFEENVSNWPRIKRIMAYVRHFMNMLKSKVHCEGSLSTAEIEAGAQDITNSSNKNTGTQTSIN